jgi:hypothetical protein
VGGADDGAHALQGRVEHVAPQDRQTRAGTSGDTKRGGRKKGQDVGCLSTRRRRLHTNGYENVHTHPCFPPVGWHVAVAVVLL